MDGIGGMTHAPETVKKDIPADGQIPAQAEGQEKTLAQQQSDQDRDAAQAAQAPAQVEGQEQEQAALAEAVEEAPAKKKGWLAAHAEEARANAAAGAEASKPLGGMDQPDQYDPQAPVQPHHGPRM